MYMGLTFGTEKAMGRKPRLVSLNSQPDKPKNVQLALIMYYQNIKHIYLATDKYQILSSKL